MVIADGYPAAVFSHRCAAGLSAVGAIAAAVGMSACGSDEPERTPVDTSPPTRETTPSVREKTPVARDGVSLTVRQIGMTCGRGGAYKARVTWKYPAGLVKSVSITVGDSPQTLFAASKKADGSAETGAWVVPGLAFRLADQATSDVLAAVKAGRGRC
jgi:hypothetical protein